MAVPSAQLSCSGFSASSPTPGMVNRVDFSNSSRYIVTSHGGFPGDCYYDVLICPLYAIFHKMSSSFVFYCIGLFSYSRILRVLYSGDKSFIRY